MKLCPSCKETKPLEDFAPHKTRGTQSKCRPCYAKYQREYYRKRVLEDEKYRLHKQKWRKDRSLVKVTAQRKKVWDYLLSHPCIDCGETDPVVLEFDHRDPKLKEFEISSYIRSERLWGLIAAEIEKCDVRCANCHRRRTAVQFGWYNGSNG